MGEIMESSVCSVNIHRTSGRSITEGLPEREAEYPFDIIHGAVQPNRPAPTFTFWKQPNDTFPMGNIVYFMYCGGRIKIGYTDNLPKRLAAIAGHSPYKPVAILVVKGSHKVEREFHSRFAAERLHCEWFILSQKMRNFLRARLCAVGRASLKNAEAEFAGRSA